MSTNAVTASNVLTHETALERAHLDIGFCLDINGQMPPGIKFQKFTKVYKDFTSTDATPDMLVDADAHADRFIAARGFTGDVATGAKVWVLWKIWAAKREAGSIFTPGLLKKARELHAQRIQLGDFYKALRDVFNNKDEESFDAGFRTKVALVMSAAGAKQLEHIAAMAEEAYELEAA